MKLEFTLILNQKTKMFYVPVIPTLQTTNISNRRALIHMKKLIKLSPFYLSEIGTTKGWKATFSVAIWESGIIELVELVDKLHFLFYYGRDIIKLKMERRCTKSSASCSRENTNP